MSSKKISAKTIKKIAAKKAKTIAKKDTKKVKEETITSLTKKVPKIVHFDDIPSVQGEPLKYSTFRSFVKMSSIGIIEPSEKKAYAIFSYKITPDIHKVVVSGLKSSIAADSKFSESVLIGLSTKDITPEVDSSNLRESIKKQLMENGITEGDADNQLADTKISKRIKDCADPFIGSNTIFLQSVIRIKEYAEDKTYEFKIPPAIFDGRKEAYLFVFCNSTPKVVPFTYPKDVPFFYEEPAAEALTEGDRLLKSTIHFGEVRHKGKALPGIYVWQKICTKVKYNNEDIQNHPAFFIGLTKKKDLSPVFKIVDNDLLKKAPKKTISNTVIHAVLQKLLKKYKITLFTCDIKIPVYPKDTNQFNSFVWKSNVLVTDELIEKDTSHPQKHNNYRSLFDNCSFEEAYNSPAAFSTTTATYAAKQFARRLLAQPKGKRSISIDGFLWQLMGGAILDAQEGTFIHKTIDNFNEDRTVYGDQKELLSKRDLRLTRDYIFSMVYSGHAQDTAQDTFSGEGYLFFDSPIHYNHPKVIPGREIDPEFLEALKKNGNDLAEYLITCRERVKRAKKYFSEWLNIGDPDDPTDLRPSSGCHAAQDVLHDIFKKIHSFGIDIDYAYSDLERIYNTAWFTKTHGRIEHCYSGKTDNSDCFNISLYQTNGELDFTKMWNAISDTERFQKEILPKLESRGFHSYRSYQASGEIYLSEVNKAKWDKTPSKKPSFGYWNFKDFATRREINIWDCVMMEFTANLQQKYIMNDLCKLFPNAKYSTYAHYTTKGYSHYGMYGLFYEPCLGGSITLPQKMSSNTSIYGGYPSEGHCKFNLDDYRCYVNDYSAFALFRYEINHMRAVKNDAQNGFMPFYSCKYYRDYHGAKNNYDQSTYYKDILFHTWLCQPDKMIAYFHFDDTVAAGFQKQNLTKKDYFTKCYEDTQAILDELNAIVKNPIVKTLPTPIVNENDPYVLTGIETTKERIWRLTLDSTKKQTLPKSKLELRLTIGNKVISFTNPKLCIKDKNGYWIITAKNQMPVIKSLELLPSYYAEKPFDSEPKLFSGRTFKHAQGVTVFGENAPDQIWEAKIKFEKDPKDGTIFKIPLSKLTGIKAGVWYTFTANVSMPKPASIYGNLVNRSDKRTEITLTYTGNGVTNTFNYNLSTDNKYAPITDIELATNTSGNVECEYFKINIAGMNIRADVFRSSDGVNITRVNKKIDEFKNTHLADTLTTDPLEAKISWLNATASEGKFKVGIQQIPNKILILWRNELGNVTVPPYSQGYEILPFPKLRTSIVGIRISIRDINDNVVFTVEAPLTPKRKKQPRPIKK